MRDSRLDEIEAIYRLRYRAFLRVAAAIAGDEELGADAVQDGFAGAVRSRARFRGGSLEPVGVGSGGQLGSHGSAEARRAPARG